MIDWVYTKGAQGGKQGGYKGSLGGFSGNPDWRTGTWIKSVAKERDSGRVHLADGLEVGCEIHLHVTHGSQQ